MDSISHPREKTDHSGEVLDQDLLQNQTQNQSNIQTSTQFLDRPHSQYTQATSGAARIPSHPSSNKLKDPTENSVKLEYISAESTTEIFDFGQFGIDQNADLTSHFNSFWMDHIRNSPIDERLEQWNDIDLTIKELFLLLMSRLRVKSIRQEFLQNPNRYIDQAINTTSRNLLQRHFAKSFLFNIFCQVKVEFSCKTMETHNNNMDFPTAATEEINDFIELLTSSVHRMKLDISCDFEKRTISANNMLHQLDAQYDLLHLLDKKGGYIEKALLPFIVQMQKNHYRFLSQYPALFSEDLPIELSQHKDRVGQIFNSDSKRIPGDGLINQRIDFLRVAHEFIEYENELFDLLTIFEEIHSDIESKLQQHPFEDQAFHLFSAFSSVIETKNIDIVKIFYTGLVLHTLGCEALSEMFRQCNEQSLLYQSNKNAFSIMENTLARMRTHLTRTKDLLFSNFQQYRDRGNRIMMTPSLQIDLCIYALLLKVSIQLFSKEVGHQLLRSMLVGTIVTFQDFTIVKEFIREDLDAPTDSDNEDKAAPPPPWSESDNANHNHIQKSVLESLNLWSNWILSYAYFQVDLETTFLVIHLLNRYKMIDEQNYDTLMSDVKKIKHHIRRHISSKSNRAPIDTSSTLVDQIPKLNIKISSMTTRGLKKGSAVTELTNIFHIIGWRSKTEPSTSTDNRQKVNIDRAKTGVNSYERMFAHLKLEVLKEMRQNQQSAPFHELDVSSISEKMLLAETLQRQLFELRLPTDELDQVMQPLYKIRDELIEAGDDLASLIYLNVTHHALSKACDHLIDQSRTLIELKQRENESQLALQSLLNELDIEDREKKIKTGNDKEAEKGTGKAKKKRNRNKKIKNSTVKTGPIPIHPKPSEKPLATENILRSESTISSEDYDLTDFILVEQPSKSTIEPLTIKAYKRTPHVYVSSLGEGRVMCCSSKLLETSAQRFCEPLPGGEFRHRFLISQCQKNHLSLGSTLQIASLQYHYDKHVKSEDKDKVPAELYAIAGSLLSYFMEHYLAHSEWLIGTQGQSDPNLKYIDTNDKRKYQVDQYTLIFKPVGVSELKAGGLEARFISFCRAGNEENMKLTSTDILTVIERSKGYRSSHAPVQKSFNDFQAVLTACEHNQASL